MLETRFRSIPPAIRSRRISLGFRVLPSSINSVMAFRRAAQFAAATVVGLFVNFLPKQNFGRGTFGAESVPLFRAECVPIIQFSNSQAPLRQVFGRSRRNALAIQLAK